MRFLGLVVCSPVQQYPHFPIYSGLPANYRLEFSYNCGECGPILTPLDFVKEIKHCYAKGEDLEGFMQDEDNELL